LVFSLSGGLTCPGKVYIGLEENHYSRGQSGRSHLSHPTTTCFSNVGLIRTNQEKSDKQVKIIIIG
jgi:hypothetical protein